MLRKVLIANRGEIAIRIARSCRDLGVGTVAVYSEADREAIHVEVCDESYLLGPAPAAESYLSIPKILEVAKKSGAEAIHPGYGFLAERRDFAAAVIDAGLTWIGPPPEAMDQMGDKVAARKTAVAANVPVVAGTKDPVDAAGAKAFADEHGYPIAVKAVMGGGGKAFRVARTADDLEDALEGASREAQAYFGDASVFVERYVDRPRHVEAQVLADNHGNVAFLGERDCSTQRRHQKLIEEAPSPAVTPEIRQTIGDAAVALAKSVGYRSAGTVEMLLGADGTLSFLEMNTRLQVEHPVTEMVCNVDLVAEQLKIASGYELEYEFIQPRGHAIECRINAENPSRNFLPSPGLIKAWDPPKGPFVRVDAGFDAGRTVPQSYDSMIAKLIVFGTDREQARVRALQALSEFHVEGIKTTIDFHRIFLADRAFVEGDVYTRYVEDEFAERMPGLLESLEPTKSTGIQASGGESTPTKPVRVEVGGKRYLVDVTDTRVPTFQKLERVMGSAAHGTAEVRAQMQGTILKVLVDEGADVEQGQLLCTLEAMKMENHVISPKTGKLSKLGVKAGQAVGTGELIAVID